RRADDHQLETLDVEKIGIERRKPLVAEFPPQHRRRRGDVWRPPAELRRSLRIERSRDVACPGKNPKHALYLPQRLGLRQAVGQMGVAFMPQQRVDALTRWSRRRLQAPSAGLRVVLEPMQ